MPKVSSLLLPTITTISSSPVTYRTHARVLAPKQIRKSHCNADQWLFFSIVCSLRFPPRPLQFATECEQPHREIRDLNEKLSSRLVLSDFLSDRSRMMVRVKPNIPDRAPFVVYVIDPRNRFHKVVEGQATHLIRTESTHVTHLT